MTLGTPHLHYRVVASTNLRAKELAGEGAPNGTIVTADAQSAGRGRQGRTWTAPPGGGLLLSVILRPFHAGLEFAPLATAVAVAETCEALAPVECMVKWPNDIWIDGRKVAGILFEGQIGHDRDEGSWLVAGIGLNAALRVEDLPFDLRETAATLGLATATEALAPLLERLSYWIEAPAEAILAAWRGRDALHGRTIRWSDGDSGVAHGVDSSGNLLVRTGSGDEVTLNSGEVHLSLG